MANVPGISSAEWVVMQVLWRQAPLTALEVFEALEGQSDWHHKTVRTLLGRLLKKGVLRREKRGGVFRFSPQVSQEECVHEESMSFLQRCFGGNARPMLAHFIEQENLTPEDVESLRAMLDHKSDRENANE